MDSMGFFSVWFSVLDCAFERSDNNGWYINLSFVPISFMDAEPRSLFSFTYNSNKLTKTGRKFAIDLLYFKVKNYRLFE